MKRPITSVPQFTGPGSTLVCALASLALLGVPLLSASILIGGLALITRFGWILCSRARILNSRVTVGFIVGIGFFVFFGQILLIAGIPPQIAHLAALTFMSFLPVLISSTNTLDLSPPESRLPIELRWALFLAMAVVAVRQPWLYPFVTSLLIFHSTSRAKVQERRFRLLVGGLLVVGWWLSQTLRPAHWWYFYQGNDSQFFESIGWSISHWGIFEHPGFVGGSIAPYHWFGYAFLGALSHLASLDPWVALMQIGVPIVAFFVVCLLTTDLGNARNSTGPSQSIVVLVTTILICGPRFDSYMFSILIAFGLIVLFNMSESANRSTLLAVPVFLCSLTLVFSKVSTSVVVLLFLVALATTRTLRREHTSWLIPLVLAGVLGITYLLLFGSVADSGTFRVSPYLEATLGELRNLLDTPSFFTHLLIWSLLVINSMNNKRKLDSKILVLSFLAPIGLVFQLVQASGTSAYFGLPSLCFLTLFAAQSWIERVPNTPVHRDYQTRFGVALLLLVGVLIGLNYQSWLAKLETLFEPARVLGDLSWSILKGSGYVIVLLGLLWVSRLFGYERWRKNGLAVVILFLCISIGIGVNSYEQMVIGGANKYTNWDGNSAPFPTEDLVELGRFIRTSSEPNIVLASNNFCCAGQEWWDQAISDLDTYTQSVHGEIKWGGANYLLPAETRRRFLVSGLRFQTGIASATPEQVHRMNLSLDFANSPTYSVARSLRAYGVRGYVVNLKLTKNRNWTNFANEKFRSGDFVYLELK